MGFFVVKCQTNPKLILLKGSEFEGSNKSIAIEEWRDLAQCPQSIWKCSEEEFLLCILGLTSYGVVSLFPCACGCSLVAC